MRKQTWIRFGLSSVIVGSAAFAALAVGCSDDDSTPITAGDSGKADTSFQDTGTGDTGTGEGGDSGDSGPLAKHAKIIAVHASPNLPDFRFCFGVGVKADGTDLAVGPLPALPDDDRGDKLPGPYGQTYPALYAGVGNPIPDITDLEPKALTGFIIPMIPATVTKIATDVKSNAAERTCDALLGATGGGGVLATTDAIKMPTIPAGTFVKGNSYLLALTGCVKGDVSGVGDGKAKCGSGYDTATGNLSIRIVKLDKTVADSAKLGLQVLHLASAVDGFFPLVVPGGLASAGVKTILGLSRDDLDGGAAPNNPVANLVNYGAFEPASMVAASEVYASADYAHATAYATFVGFKNIPAGDAGDDGGMDASVQATPFKKVTFPFGALQKLSYGSFDGGSIHLGPAGEPLYTSGGNYTIIFLGDPTAEQLQSADGGTNFLYKGYGIHMLMFPNDPALPSL